jgi:hypothetical protein
MQWFRQSPHLLQRAAVARRQRSCGVLSDRQAARCAGALTGLVSGSRSVAGMTPPKQQARRHGEIHIAEAKVRGPFESALGVIASGDKRGLIQFVKRQTEVIGGLFQVLAPEQFHPRMVSTDLATGASLVPARWEQASSYLVESRTALSSPVETALNPMRSEGRGR